MIMIVMNKKDLGERLTTDQSFPVRIDLGRGRPEIIRHVGIWRAVGLTVFVEEDAAGEADLFEFDDGP